MTSFSERLAAAKAASKSTRDVEVLLDTDLSEQREELRADLAAAKAEVDRDQRLSYVSPAETAIQEKLNAILDESEASLITLRFSRLPGSVWSDIADRCPARLGAPLDEHFGYNMLQAAILAAPLSGVRVEGDEEFPLEVTPEVDEWADLFATIAGAEMTAIASAIFELNVFEPQQSIGQLKKELAFRPASETSLL